MGCYIHPLQKIWCPRECFKKGKKIWFARALFIESNFGICKIVRMQIFKNTSTGFYRLRIKYHSYQWRTQKKFRGGGQGYGGPRRGSGGGAPRTPENFWKFAKYFLRKLQKCIILAYFSKKFNKPCVNFSRVRTKNTNCWEILRNFEKLWYKFNREIEFFTIFGKWLLKIERSEIK